MNTLSSQWLTSFSDSMLISELNLPGTHDSAAISDWRTLHACQNMSITTQLRRGIRVLDVRLKIKKSGEGKYWFQTCHGHFRTWFWETMNEFQSFASLMQECKAFLAENPSEFIAMSLKVDDWNGTERDGRAVLVQLSDFLKDYPMCYITPDLPSLGQVRGKILLFSRIFNDTRYGTPISWEENTKGSYAYPHAQRNYNVYVQDFYRDLTILDPESNKLKLVIETFPRKLPGEILLNYASGNWYGRGVYVMQRLLGHFGLFDAAERVKTFGWTLFDYAFWKYETDQYGEIDIIRFLISSNFGYAGFQRKFKVRGVN